jgi:hypothetical protein
MNLSTSLHKSPFALLGVSTRDRADKIVEQAEERSLFLDSEICTKARSDLTTVRNRLATEIRWLPGVSPNRAISLLETLTSDIDSLKDDTSLPPLANANVLAAAFEILDPDMDASSWQDWIIDFAYTVDNIDSYDVQREINADRTVSGFPEINGIEQIESELDERRRYFTETIKSALNKLPPMKLVEVVTDVVESTTELGEEHAPQLIHELVDRYELEANRYLGPEAENIVKLLEAIKRNAVNGESAIKTQIDKLDQVARKWDAIAQPIQLSMKAQGLEHKLSHEVALGIRGLAIDLFNQHDMVSTAKKLTATLQELFEEVPEVAERLDEDADAIDQIVKDRLGAEQIKAVRDKEITYEAEIGLVFKDKLKISPNGVEWKGQRIGLNDITSVRWGAVKKSVNGIPTGTDYTVAIGKADAFEMVIETARAEIYQSFTDCLWKAVCVRLLEQYLLSLKAGKELWIGGKVKVDDNGINLIKHKFFGNETVYVKWGDVTYNSYNGELFITAKDDKKLYVALSYLSVKNVHILEAMIRLSFKNWRGRLSGILDQ